MTRDEAIAVAKAAAAERWTDHGYITDPYDARWADWMPHEWVVDAVLNAAVAAPELVEALTACHDALVRIREAGGSSTSAEILAERALANVAPA